MQPNDFYVDTMELDKTTTVYLTVNGEMCNRLARGTRIVPGKRKGDWLRITWRKGKKKAGFFIQILVFKSPEIQINPLAPFFRCIMTDSNIEGLDDEELLMYYETTKKLLENKMQEGESKNGKIKILQQKLEYIEDELKSRSLWEAE